MGFDFQEYHLSCELRGHKDDVRGICVCGSVGLATSSRDKTVRVWAVDEDDSRVYTPSKVLIGHSSFVGPLAWIPPDEEFPDGGIVSGGMDSLILVWNLRTGERVRTLKGHKLQVTGVEMDNGDIVSSSVDCTMKRWRDGHEVESWVAHESAVQAVIRLPSGELVSGSSDTTLKVWRGMTCVHTFIGHTDTVRYLARMHDLNILSASHDGSIKCWSLTGQVLVEMVGHTSIVYSVDSHVSGLIVSGSEDCSTRIWKDGACVQCIEHPGCVWDAKFLENGDIVTACSDGVVRIWSSYKDRIADQLDCQSYVSNLLEYKLNRKSVGGLKLKDLPGREALNMPGIRDGQSKVIREGDNGVAYSWNVNENKWEKIGEVVDGPDDQLTQPIFDGVHYDYVFDVDVGEGHPIRKLPYNLSDDPYSTADTWLLEQNLPLSYRNQIVEFILQNCGQNRRFVADSSFRDPFTGSSSYIPDDPFNLSVISSRPTFKYIPKKEMLVFDMAQFDKIVEKLVDFNTALSVDPEKKSISLSGDEISKMCGLVKWLKDSSNRKSNAFVNDECQIVLLIKVLSSWPPENIFPVIDLLRMIVLYQNGAMLLFKHIKEGNDVLSKIINKVPSPPLHPYFLTSIRLITNLFTSSCSGDWLCAHHEKILETFSSYAFQDKRGQLAFATMILNYAVLFISRKDYGGQTRILSAALQVAQDESVDDDTKFRALVAIGSLMLDGLVKEKAVVSGMEKISVAAKHSAEPRVAQVGADIELLLKHH